MESRARTEICRRAGLVGGKVSARRRQAAAAEKHARVFALAAQGFSGAAIGRAVGLSRERVRQILDRVAA